MMTLMMCLGTMSYGQDTYSVVLINDSPSLYKNNINLGGYYIEQGAKLKNTSMLVGIIGVFIGTVGLSQDIPEPFIIIGGAMVLATIPINIVGNNKIAKGGRLIKTFE